MPITVSQMAANEKPLTVTIDGETLSLVYFPNRLTMKNINTFDSGMEGMNQALSEMIKSWDLTVSLEDSSMYPLDPDSLAALGVGFLRKVMWAIIGDANPNS
jgi:hypothetical protein